MIFPDANLLLYAEDSLSRDHEVVRSWWDACLSGTETVDLCWPVINAFIRIATNPRIHERPLLLGRLYRGLIAGYSSHASEWWGRLNFTG